MQLEALVDAYIKIHSFLNTRADRPDFNICCEDMIDTTGDMRENFYRHYGAISKAKQIREPLQFIRRTKNKFHRIEALEAPIQNGWLAFKTDLSEELWDQFCAFPAGKYLDGPDATEGAWSQQITQTAANRDAYVRRIEHKAMKSNNMAYC